MKPISDHEIESLKKIHNQTKYKIQNIVKKIIPCLKDESELYIQNKIKNIWYRYLLQRNKTDEIEKASKVKKDIEELESRAKYLAGWMNSLGEGAITVLNQPGSFDEDVFTAAEPWELPANDPSGKIQKIQNAWVTRLEALAKLAHAKAERIGQVTGRGGQKPFKDFLYGSADEWLAGACLDFLKDHGCDSKAEALRMMQAIRELSGQKIIKPTSGRKALRKMSRTDL